MPGAIGRIPAAPRNSSTVVSRLRGLPQRTASRFTVNRTFRLARLWSNSVIRAVGETVEGEVINVSAWNDEDKAGDRYRSYFPNASAYFTSNTSGERGLADSPQTTYELDLTAPLADDLRRRFDFVLNHTTLEHVFDTFTAFANLCDLSRDAVLVVVPFAQKMHYTESYGDYWRFTPQALRALFARSGFEVVFEAASPDADSSIYVVALGSRHPGRWADAVPRWAALDHLGDWIGVPRWRRAARSAKRLVTGGAPSAGDGLVGSEL